LSTVFFFFCRHKEGNQEPALHNALAKMRIDMNSDAESFLKTSQVCSSANRWMTIIIIITIIVAVVNKVHSFFCLFFAKICFLGV